jgi:hypothetical protein
MNWTPSETFEGDIDTSTLVEEYGFEGLEQLANFQNSRPGLTLGIAPGHTWCMVKTALY